VGTNEHIFANFSCDADHPLRCVLQNTELLHTFAQAGFTELRNVFLAFRDMNILVP